MTTPGFLSSPSFKKIVPKQSTNQTTRQRQQIRRPGQTGTGTRDDPIRRETPEETKQRTTERETSSRDNLRRIQQEFSRTGERITPQEAEAILRGETPQSVVDRANKSIRSTPEQRFIESGGRRIAVSKGVASLVDEQIKSGGFERARQQEETSRLQSIADKSPELTLISTSQGSRLVTKEGEFVGGISLPKGQGMRLVTSSGRDVTPVEELTGLDRGGVISAAPTQTRAGRFVSAFGRSIVNPGETARELRLDRLQPTERAALTAGFTLSAATAPVTGLAGQTATKGIPAASRLAGGLGKATGATQGFFRTQAARIGIGATSRQRIVSVATSKPVALTAFVTPSAIESTRLVSSGSSTVQQEIVRQVPRLVVQGAVGGAVGTAIVRNPAFRSGLGAGVQKGVVAGNRFTLGTTPASFNKADLGAISIKDTAAALRTASISRSEPFNRLVGLRETTSIRSGFIPTKRSFDERGQFINAQTIYPKDPTTGLLTIPTFTSRGRLDLQTTFTARSGLGVPRVQVLPDAASNIISSRTRTPAIDISLKDYLSSRPVPPRFERGLPDFFPGLAPRSAGLQIQKRDSISISQLGVRDIGFGVPRFSSRTPRSSRSSSTALTDDIIPSIPSSFAVVRKALPNKKAQLLISQQQTPSTRITPISSLRLPPRQQALGARRISSATKQPIKQGSFFVPFIDLSAAQRMISSQETRTSSLSRQTVVSETDLFSNTNFRININQKPRSTQDIISSTAQDTDLSSRLILLPGGSTPTIPGFGGGGRTPPPTPPPTPPSILIPKIDTPGGSLFGGKQTKKKKTKEQFAFATSLTGATLGIKETQKKSTGFTGTELRGI